MLRSSGGQGGSSPKGKKKGLSEKFLHGRVQSPGPHAPHCREAQRKSLPSAKGNTTTEKDRGEGKSPAQVRCVTTKSKPVRACRW